jgi:hypothetical protein
MRELRFAEFIHGKNQIFGAKSGVSAENQPKPAMIGDKTPGEVGKTEAPRTLLFVTVEKAEVVREID